jgi:hypothetical protein
MKKILVMIAVLLSLSVLAASCRVGTKYTKCIADCDNKADVLYLACFSGSILNCSLAIDIYTDSCKKACE